MAAEQYIEDHYDAIAEGVVEFVFQEHSLKTELVAEVGESIAEQVVPYSCVAAPGWETVGASCSLSFRTDQPMDCGDRCAGGREVAAGDWPFRAARRSR